MEQAWYPQSFGFIPDSSNVSTQVAAVSNVYDQYYDVLTYGDVDPAEYLPHVPQRAGNCWYQRHHR